MKGRGILALTGAVACAVGIAAPQALAAGAWTVDQTTGNDTTCPLTHVCKTIQAAVNLAAPGDTIVVHDGLYSENVLVVKPLTLTGTTRSRLAGRCDGTTSADPTKDTIVDGGGIGGNSYGFDIEADDVSVSGFVFQHATWGVVIDLGTQTGAYSGFTFEGNVFQQVEDGLFTSTSGANPSLVQRNCFRLNTRGGIHAGWGNNDPNSNLRIIGNKFLQNDYGAIVLAASTQDRIEIGGNISRAAGLFILLINVTNFSITGNIVKNTTTGSVEQAAIFLGGGNSNGTIQGNIVKAGETRGLVFERQYTFSPNTNLLVKSNILSYLEDTAVEAKAKSLYDSTFLSNIGKTKGKSGLFLHNNNTGNTFQGNIFKGKPWGCRAVGTSVGGNTWSGNIGKKKNTPGTCFP